MFIRSKSLLIILLFTFSVIDGNRVRRQRRETILNNKKDFSNDEQISGKNALRNVHQGIRQNNPNQRQYGYGSIQGLNYPYAGAGVGAYQYGQGQSPYGQSAYSSLNNPYYNQYGSGMNSFYGSGSSYMGNQYNPSGYSSNYYPSSGGNYYGNYRWNTAEKSSLNLFLLCGTLFLSSALMKI